MFQRLNLWLIWQPLSTQSLLYMAQSKLNFLTYLLAIQLNYSNISQFIFMWILRTRAKDTYIHYQKYNKNYFFLLIIFPSQTSWAGPLKSSLFLALLMSKLLLIYSSKPWLHHTTLDSLNQSQSSTCLKQWAVKSNVDRSFIAIFHSLVLLGILKW